MEEKGAKSGCFKCSAKSYKIASALTMAKSEKSYNKKIHVTFSSRHEVKRESYAEISMSGNSSLRLQEILQDNKRKVAQSSVAEPQMRHVWRENSSQLMKRASNATHSQTSVDRM